MRHAVILAGGSGKRFWPRSRLASPKQFMRVAGRHSLLAETVRRLGPVVPPARVWVVTAERYVERVCEELPQLPAGQVLGEPAALNTGPAVALAALKIGERDPQARVVVQAADHHIADVSAYRRLLRAGFGELASGPELVLTGFRPLRPATGYGYIELGERLRERSGHAIHLVRGYREKPDAATARRWLRSGRYLWNGCVFFWQLERLCEQLRRELPGVMGPLERTRGRADALARAYRRLPVVSIEHGLVEKLRQLRVVVGDCGWEDVGTWEGLARLLPRDAGDNAVLGEHLGLDSDSNIVVSDDGLVATMGVSGLVVVRSGDAVLVVPREREGELRRLLEALEARPGLRRFL